MWLVQALELAQYLLNTSWCTHLRYDKAFTYIRILVFVPIAKPLLQIGASDHFSNVSKKENKKPKPSIHSQLAKTVGRS